MRANTSFPAVHLSYGKSYDVNPLADICENNNEIWGSTKDRKF
jgi:hypothetical protein